MILVHNCCVTQRDIDVVMNHFTASVRWCLCPRSNRYISRLEPPVELLRRNRLDICLGTDSLASNDRLSVFEEMRMFPEVPLPELLSWAAEGGARALDMDAELGEIGGTAIELLRRPYISYELVAKVIGRGEGVTPAMAQRIETEIRYAGYIAREERIIRDIQRHENVKIPEDFDYAPIETMTLESREKLEKIRPRTLAQAGRIPGVSPSDLAQLSIVLLKQGK